MKQGISQSERDWSYALRGLEGGDSPADIEAKIESFRQDKPKPHYYAHRTVSRARAHAAANPRSTRFPRSEDPDWVASAEPDGASE